jgi:hypothetical protein
MAEPNQLQEAVPNAGDREFEFDGAQNAVIERLSATMRFVAIVNLLGAVLYGLSAAIHLVSWLVRPATANLAMLLVMGSMGALFYFTARWTTHAAKSFKYIVATAGNDVRNLMVALGDLLKLYRLQKLFIIVCFSIAAIGMLLTIVAMGRGGPSA